MHLEKIGILTSGGDSPGMNTAIRAATRTALQHHLEVVGIEAGYQGIFDRRFISMGPRDVGGVMQRGGTFLYTARCARFMKPEGRDEAVRNLQSEGIEALIVIGGNGSLTGALELQKLGVPVVGLPGSIDNDLYGTDVAIGVDTCLNTILTAIDNIKDTASSHRRAFILEVMGRNSGYLAMMGALAGGAEVAVVPEIPIELSEIDTKLRAAFDRNKSHFIVIVAEGAALKTSQIHDYLCSHGAHEVRVTILGHIQRGGAPTAFDRILATRLGSAAVETLLSGQSGVMMGLNGKQIEAVPLEDVVTRTKQTDYATYQLIKLLS
ncbi:MAG TPA: 6-phosphofructokinase [Chloroflexia bacterium]|nr:6-phosphofructokinase [Chloroflexia bacterium]